MVAHIVHSCFRIEHSHHPSFVGYPVREAPPRSPPPPGSVNPLPAPAPPTAGAMESLMKLAPPRPRLPLALSAAALVPLLTPASSMAGEPVEHPDVLVDLEAYTQQNPPEQNVTANQPPQRLGDKIVFVNYDGADMNGCGNKPQNNCSTIFQGTVEPFGGDKALRAAIIQKVREATAPFGISVTDTRPTNGDYDMEMVGRWAGVQNPGFAGIAPGIDCWDSSGGQTSFTLIGGSAEGIAEVILQEIAHTWGMSHVDETTDLLFPTTAGTSKSFVDGCFQIVSDTNLTPSSSGCSHHQEACNSNSRQNSYAELLMIFGPGTADMTPPTAAITAPSDGQSFPSGANVDIDITLDDNQTPMLFTTRLVLASPAIGDPIETVADYAGPSDYTFPVNGLPDGTYSVTLEVSDEDGNMAAPDSITFTIGNAGGGDSGGDTSGGSTSGGGTSGGGTSGGGDGGASSDGSGLTTAGGGPGMDTTDEGCSCRSEGDLPRAGWMLALLLPLLRRRRR